MSNLSQRPEQRKTHGAVRAVQGPKLPLAVDRALIAGMQKDEIVSLPVNTLDYV